MFLTCLRAMAQRDNSLNFCLLTVQRFFILFFFVEYIQKWEYFTAVRNWNEFIFPELKPQVTIFSAVEFSLKFTKDLCLHWFIVASGKTTHSV